MNWQFPSQPTTAKDLLWQSIAESFNRPLTSPFSAPSGQYWVSRAMQPTPPLHAIRLTEEFVDMVASSKHLAFNLERPITGIRCLEITPLADKFTELVNALYQCSFDIAVPHHELGENAKALLSVFRHLGVTDARLTGRPESIIGGGGLREDEFINGVITRIREETLKADYRNRLKNRIDEAKKSASKISRLMKRLREKHGYFDCRGLVLAYAPDQEGSLNLEDCAAHLQKLLDQLGQVSSIFGCFWSRRFHCKLGYQTYLVIFCQAEFGPGIDSYMNDLWRHLTKDSNMVLPDHLLPTYPQGAQKQIERMILGNIHLRLIPNGELDHHGFCDFSASANASSSKEAVTRAWPLPAEPGSYFVGKQLI